MSEISLYIDSYLVGKRAKRIFSRRMWMLFWFWIESSIREFRESKTYDIFTFLPCSYPLLCGFPTCWHTFHHKGTLLIPKISRNAYLSGKVPLWIYTVILRCPTLYCVKIRLLFLHQINYTSIWDMQCIYGPYLHLSLILK